MEELVVHEDCRSRDTRNFSEMIYKSIQGVSYWTSRLLHRLCPLKRPSRQQGYEKGNLRFLTNKLMRLHFEIQEIVFQLNMLRVLPWDMWRQMKWLEVMNGVTLPVQWRDLRRLDPVFPSYSVEGWSSITTGMRRTRRVCEMCSLLHNPSVNQT